jgi:site-specific recombinase XerD
VVRVHNGPLSISSNSQIVYQDLIARGRQVETARRWHSLVQRFEAYCGAKDSYNRADVVKFVAELRQEGMKQSSINARLKALRLLCQIQNWDGGFPRLSMPKVKNSEVNRPLFTAGQVVHIISRAKEVCSERELAFLAAASVYGLRREEIGTLEVRDGVVKVNGAKGGESTFQIIPDAIKEYMKGYRACRDVRYMTRVFQRVMSKVGMELNRGYGWHSIRRALATELTLSDVSALNIMRFMRWSNTGVKGEFGMLAIYAQWNQAEIDKCIFRVHPFLCAWSENV